MEKYLKSSEGYNMNIYIIKLIPKYKNKKRTEVIGHSWAIVEKEKKRRWLLKSFCLTLKELIMIKFCAVKISTDLVHLLFLQLDGS